MDKDTANRIPSIEKINAASALMVFDDKGNKVSFGSLYAESRTLVVFIRERQRVSTDTNSPNGQGILCAG
jgi:hypothetical protein